MKYPQSINFYPGADFDPRLWISGSDSRLSDGPGGGEGGRKKEKHCRYHIQLMISTTKYRLESGNKYYMLYFGASKIIFLTHA
jgi:hypothetical protein